MKGEINKLRKHTQEYVKTFFEDNGCILISEYENARKPLEYICSCGNRSKTTFDSFKRGSRCKECGLNKLAEHFKHDYEYVYNYFESKGCLLLSKEYKNGHSNLDYVCECGNISSIRFFDFRNGKRCWRCRSEKINEKQKLDYDYVFNFFKENNCILLTKTYVNARQKLKYVCECGKVSYIVFDKFRIGQRCNDCGTKKYSGENHYKYDQKISDEERQTKRNYPEYREWAKNVKERDNFTCQKCHQIGHELVSHHIENYKDNFELRTNINNGITLCKKCHNSFHSLYGYRNTNGDQLKEFLSKDEIRV